jgi:hypothetical protein
LNYSVNLWKPGRDFALSCGAEVNPSDSAWPSAAVASAGWKTSIDDRKNDVRCYG